MFRKLMVATLLATAALGPSAASAKTTTQSYTNLYVFGDSLVDAGNIFVATGGATPNPALGYYNGRFTNGYDYTDLLSLSLFGTPTKPSLLGGNNFAFGGARAVNNTTGVNGFTAANGGDTIPDVALQITTYETRPGTVADPNALYVLNFGGNDIFGLLNNKIGGFTPAAYKAAIVSTYLDGLQALDSFGARNILFTGIPNANDLTGVALEVEQALQTGIGMRVFNPNTSVFDYSYFSFFQRISTDPGQFGLPPLRTDKSCIELMAQATGCVGIFSFDGTHPTAAVQDALFSDMNKQFKLTAGVPEPASWALMIGGFGLVGGAMRRGRRALAIA